MKIRVVWDSKPNIKDEYEIEVFSDSEKEAEKAIDNLVESEFRERLTYEIIDQPDWSLTGRPD